MIDRPARPDLWPGPAVFEAVGCLRADPRILLLRGDDGRLYRQALPDGEPIPLAGEPGPEWAVDSRSAARRPRPSRTREAA